MRGLLLGIALGNFVGFRGDVDLILARNARLEVLDCFAEPAAQLGKSASAEDQDHDSRYDQKLGHPDAKHGPTPEGLILVSAPAGARIGYPGTR